MTVSHLKRNVAPKTWAIDRKKNTFITRPKPKGQPLEHTLPVIVLLRDELHLVDTARQARTLMRSSEITVNGTRIYDIDAAVGLLDVFAAGGKSYRLVLDRSNTLRLAEAKNATRLDRITGKTSQKGGKTQVNCQSGTAFLMDKDAYKVGDSVVLKDGKVAEHYALKDGASVYIIRGSHIGKLGKVTGIDVPKRTIIISTEQGEITTSLDYVYVVGKETPMINLG